jgi:uncharacterized membrane protein required for colicin V production
MIIDIVVGVLALLFGALSYRRGLLAMLAGILSLVIACVAAGFVGGRAAGLAAERWNVSAPWVYAICCVLAWVVLYVLARIMLGFIAKRLGSGEEGKPKPWNKQLGFLFGALEALVLCWFVLAILDAIPEDSRSRSWPRLHDELEGSFFTTYVVRPTSPAAYLELQPLIADLTALAENPKALEAIEGKPEIQQFVEHEKVQAILKDEKIVEEWKRGRPARLLSHPTIRDALEDPELRKMLRELPIRQILHEAAEKARQAKE